jgi:Putative adipose-regulatory protein (Seipin)
MVDMLTSYEQYCSGQNNKGSHPATACLNNMPTNTEIQGRRMLPPPTTMSSVEGVVTRIAAQILHRHDYGQQQQQRHDFYHQDAQYNNYSFFDKGPLPPPEFGGIIPFIGRMLKLWILTTALLLASATSYIAAYHYALMPPRCATVPLFFECTATTTTTTTTTDNAAAAADPMHVTTSTSSSTPSNANAIELPRKRFNFGHDYHHHHQYREKKQQQQHQEQIIHVLPSTAAASSATATVDLFARHVSWEAFHPSVIPPPVAQKRLLQPRQAYYIELSLTLPASNRNQHGAGMFGVHTQLLSSSSSSSNNNNSTCLLAMSRRSARFPHESSWIQVIRNIFLLPALLVGAMEESRSVTVLAFRHYTESKDLPLVRCTLFCFLQCPFRVC